jgi:hypothetical protein
VFDSTSKVLLGPEIWSAFGTPGTIFYHSTWVPVIALGAVVQICTMILSIIALTAILKKKKAVPRIMITFYGLGLCLVAIDMLIAFVFIPSVNPELAKQVSSESMKKMIGMVASALIWIPYFLSSGRVKNTFVND